MLITAEDIIFFFWRPSFIEKLVFLTENKTIAKEYGKMARLGILEKFILSSAFSNN